MSEGSTQPERAQRGVVVGALMLAMLLAALDQTIVSTALPTIVSDLGGLNHLSWVVTAYMLATTASTPLWGKLGDQYGRKTLFMASIVVFLIGSALCGLAQNMVELIGFRAVQGLGGGGLIVLAQAIVGDVVAPRDRGRYQGAFGAVFGVSSVGGPLLGGLFVDNLSWRWVFYINLPIGVLALIVIAIVLRGKPEREPHKIDYLGTALLAGAAVCLVLMTTWGGTQYPWGSGVIIGLGVGAVVLAVGWVLAERRAAEPVMPLHLFRSSVFSLSAAISLVVGFAMFGALTYLPLFLQVVHGVSPTLSGVHLLPMVGGMLFTSILSGQLISRYGRYKIYPVLGTAVMALGLFLLSRVDEHSSTLTMSVSFCVLGLGLGLVLQVLIIAVQNTVGYEDLGAATSGVTFFRSIGGSFGVATFGSIFSNRLAVNMADVVEKVQLPAGFDPKVIQEDPTQLKKLPAAVSADFIHAYALSIQTVFQWAVPVALVAFVLTWFLREVPLRDTSRVSDFGQGLGGAPSGRSSLHEIERAISRLAGPHLRRGYYELLAAGSGLDLAASDCWLIAKLARHGPVDSAELARNLNVTVEAGQPHVDRLVDRGLVARSNGSILLTPSGQDAAERLFQLRREYLGELLKDWSPEQHADLAAMLNRLARQQLGEDADGRAVRPPEEAERRATGSV